MTVYAMQFRPPSFCTLPDGIEITWVKVPQELAPHFPNLEVAPREHMFGEFTTNRPLTTAEMDAFQIVDTYDPVDELTVTGAMGLYHVMPMTDRARTFLADRVGDDKETIRTDDGGLHVEGTFYLNAILDGYRKAVTEEKA